MKTDQIIIPSFIAGYVITLIATFLKLNHLEYANTFLGIGLLSFALFLILAVAEVTKSNKIDSSEKWLWTFGLILMGSIVGFVYIASARKRIK